MTQPGRHRRARRCRIALPIVLALVALAGCTSSETPPPKNASTAPVSCTSQVVGTAYEPSSRLGVGVLFGEERPEDVFARWNGLAADPDAELPSLELDIGQSESQEGSDDLLVYVNDDTAVWFSAAADGTLDGLGLWSAAYGGVAEEFGLALQYLLILADPISDYDRQVGDCVFSEFSLVAVSLQTLAGVSYRADWNRIEPGRPDLILTIVPSTGFPEADAGQHRRLGAEMAKVLAEES